MGQHPASPHLLIALVGEPGAARTALGAICHEAGLFVWDVPDATPGHFAAVWPSIIAAKPDVVVCAATETVINGIELRLDWTFDLRIDVIAPDAAERLRQACTELGEWTRLGLWGGAAGGVEIGLGTLLHSTRVPLRGLTLCSMQAAMLTFASASLSRRSRVLWVAVISAGLKAFSPGGGRVRPMVAISVQGVLFSQTVQLLGWNYLGVGLGGALMGMWAALQGFFLQYLLLGSDLVVVYKTLVRWLEESWHLTAPSMPMLLAGWALLHAAVVGTATMIARRLRQPPRSLQAVIDRSPPPGSTPAVTSWGQRVRRELVRWQFWLPFAIVVLVLTATGRTWEELAWVALRFLTIGFLVVALISLFQPASLAGALRRRGWWGPAAAFSRALRPRR